MVADSIYIPCVAEYPTKTHLKAVGSSFPLEALWAWTNDTAKYFGMIYLK